LLCLFTFTTAGSLPTDIARNGTAIFNRQASNGNYGIFYDNSCDTLKGKLQQFYPKACILTLYQKKNMSKGYTWDITPYIFGINCNLIGNAPGNANLENTWFYMASQLPYTMGNHTHNNVPEFKYATQHYNGKSMGSYVEEWNKNNSGIDAHHWQFIFDFA
jgi:hypothetical protein